MAKNLFALYLLGPRLYGHLTDGSRPYIPNVFESLGTSMVSFGNALATFCWSTSPLIVPYLLLRYDSSSIFVILKYSLTIYFVAFIFRTFGRATSTEYRQFISVLHEVLNDPAPSVDLSRRLKQYDYEVSVAPVADYIIESHEERWFPQKIVDESDQLMEPLKSVRVALAYWAANTFGRRMLFPGAMALLKALVGGVLIENRRKHIMTKEGERFILKTIDGNFIDSMFWNKRGSGDNGNTLVICFEGNSGFYEAGIAVTPNALKYSVLGWNMPGFGESTGIPFPHHILSAADAVMQFATKKLGFDESQIVLYAWSIGGFSASWVAANYQNVRGVVLDACFDDLLPLAEARMPSFMSSLVSYTVKEYLHLPVSEQINKYPGPLTVIRRLNDEIIITNDTGNSAERRASNRANQLLKKFLRSRYPGLLRELKDEEVVNVWLYTMPEDRLTVFDCGDPPQQWEVSDPASLEALDHARRSKLIQRLCNKHFFDFDASHNVPLDPMFFNVPTALPGGRGHRLGNGNTDDGSGTFEPKKGK